MRSPRVLLRRLAGFGLGLASCTDPLGSDEADADLIDPVEGICPANTPERRDPFADCVEHFEPAEGVSFGHDAMPDIVLGPPQGGGQTMGGTHVASLGCGGSITLHFSEPWPIDGPGPDFVVFENAFVAGAQTFIEPAQVLVSDDGVGWYAFDCDPTLDDPEGCAGLRPVVSATDLDLDTDTNTDLAAAGGDAFDLADVGLPEARYVRLVDRTAEHYGTQTWCQGNAGGFDLDALGARKAAP
ncbi:MAG: cell surface protein [Myxococcota bacterium]